MTRTKVMLRAYSLMLLIGLAAMAFLAQATPLPAPPKVPAQVAPLAAS